MVKTWHDVLAVAVLCKDELLVDFCLEKGANPSDMLTNKQVNTLSLVQNDQELLKKMTSAVLKPMPQLMPITRAHFENSGQVRCYITSRKSDINYIPSTA
jgi:hypothetical protein